MSPLPKLNPPLSFLPLTPAEVSCAHLPGQPQPVRTPDVDSHQANGPTRDKHAEPHGTSTRDTHNVLKLAHQALMCLRYCLLSHKPRGQYCLHARYFCQCLRCAPWPFGSRHEHAAIQANAELTGSLHRDRPSTSSRCRHGLTQIMSHPRDGGHALLTRACSSVASVAHAMLWGVPHTRTAVGHARALALRDVHVACRPESGPGRDRG